MRFEWDRAKAAANVRKHRVSFHEAATILEDPLSTTFPDEIHSEEETRSVTIGVSEDGHVLVVAHTERKRHGRSSAPVEQRGAARVLEQANRVDVASATGVDLCVDEGRRPRPTTSADAQEERSAERRSPPPSFDDAVNEALRGGLNPTRAVSGKGGLRKGAPADETVPTPRGEASGGARIAAERHCPLQAEATDT